MVRLAMARPAMTPLPKRPAGSPAGAGPAVFLDAIALPFSLSVRIVMDIYRKNWAAARRNSRQADKETVKIPRRPGASRRA